MPLSLGQLLNNRYRVVELLGKGGFGAVYHAWDTTFEIPCAIKENLDISQKAQRQFMREAKILHTLRHPNLPLVTDYFFAPEQGQYLVMDYVQGEDLHEILEQSDGPLHETRVLEWIEQVCSALEYLHTQNPPIIHRDVKPSNIKITPEGKAILVDFGIAKIYDADMATTQGARAVTPGFSPPEQYGQGRTDAQSDIYALGATCYTLLVGSPPPDSVDLITRRAPQLLPVSIANPRVSQHISAVIEKAMSLDSAERYGSMREFRVSLREQPERGPFDVASSISVPEKAPLPDGTLSVASAHSPDVHVPPTGTARKMPWGWIGILSAVALAIVLLFVFFSRVQQNNSVIQATPSFPESMAFIPAGSFQMGSKTGEEDERPIHTVYLDGFWIDKYEVTNQQFAEFLNAMEEQPEGNLIWFSRDSSNAHIHHRGAVWTPDPGFEDHPVTEVTWYGANAFCGWRAARLPTEAEWEKAARGRLEGAKYPWGDEAPVCQVGTPNGAKFDDDADCNDQGPEPIGSYSPNAYGLFDMVGNVWEWVGDWYSSAFYEQSPAENPTGPDSGEARVLRGGSWNYDMEALRVSTRLKDPPDGSGNDFGFRCARPQE